MSKKSLFVAAASAILAAVVLGTIAQVRKAPADQDDGEQNQQAARRPNWLSVQNGETVLTLDAATRSRAQITVVSIEAVSGRQEFTAPAVVLAAQDLVSLRNARLTARTRIEKAEANLAVSRREYERLKTLYQDSQNASEKALQAAEGMFKSDRAEAQAAHEDLELQAAAARQTWGDVVANWVRDGVPELDRIFNQSELLIQVTLAAASNISLEIPGGKPASAHLISPYPHVDPRVQGPSFLYEARALPGLAPGVNLVAHVPAGPRARGVLIPESAVLWWQGRAWIYQRLSPDHFARRAIPMDRPFDNGYFVAKGFRPGDQIVLKGADWLLSEEFRYQAQPEGQD